MLLGRLGLTALLASGVAGCSAPARQLDWQVVFGSGADASSARVLRASIREGGCAGMPIYTESVRADGTSTPMLPPELGPGRYGFQVAAIDASCVPYAAGCVEIDLPQPEGTAVLVELGPQIGSPLCAPARCNDGECQGDSDGGVLDGGVPDGGPLDARVPDGGRDGGSFECPSGFADCNLDPADLCEASLDTPQNCGGCWVECQLDHATPACSSGACAIVSCDTGWSDCDGSPANGCETSLETLTDCGGCGTRCELANAVERCAAGGCELVSCYPGYQDCDSTASNGCERSLETATDCGTCGNACGGVEPLCALTAAGASCVSICPAEAPTGCGLVCVDPSTSTRHCGACGVPCNLPNAAGRCVAGTCGIGACDPQWGNCDGATASGCERSLTTRASCGSCGATCDSPTGVLSCSTGACRIDSCFDGLDDCNGAAADGCEADLSSPSHCAACGVSCSGGTPLCGLRSGDTVECLAACAAAAPTNCGGRCLDTASDNENCGSCGFVCALDNAIPGCAASVCRVASCAPGYSNCDGDDATGCEARPDVDPENCGACGVACPTRANADATCSGSTCGFGCHPGFGNCDGMADNGCEQALTTLDHCGACGRTCSRANASATCASGACQIDTCTSGFDNCDARDPTGCETNTNADRFNCGMCDNRCTGGSMMMCCTGTCGSC